MIIILRSKILVDWSFENTEAKIFVRKNSYCREEPDYTDEFNGTSNDFEIPFTDRASVENAITVAAVCLALGTSPEIIAKGTGRTCLCGNEDGDEERYQ